MQDKAASLKWLSQYPWELEYALPPRTGLELERWRDGQPKRYVEGDVVILLVRPTVGGRQPRDGSAELRTRESRSSSGYSRASSFVKRLSHEAKVRRCWKGMSGVYGDVTGRNRM